MDTLTVAKLAERIENYHFEVDNDSLQVPALADPSGPDCYPSTNITIYDGEQEVLVVEVWKMGYYAKGPNHPKNGSWIGHGWQWLQDDDDGTCCGRPTVKVADNGMILVASGDNVGHDDLIPLDGFDGDAQEIADRLQKILDEAYDSIEVNPASDDDIIDMLGNPDYDLELEDIGSVGIYVAMDAGRIIYAYEQSHEVFESADDCVDDALRWIKDKYDELKDSKSEVLESLQKYADKLVER